MYIYNKQFRVHRHYAGDGILDSIAQVAENEVVRKGGKKVLETTANKVGNVAGEKIVSEIDKLVNRKNTSLNAKSRDVIKTLNQPRDVTINNVLEELVNKL